MVATYGLRDWETRDFEHWKDVKESLVEQDAEAFRIWCHPVQRFFDEPNYRFPKMDSTKIISLESALEFLCDVLSSDDGKKRSVSVSTPSDFCLWHDAQDRPPQTFEWYLSGNKNQLTKWICEASDTRTLDNLLKKNPADYWARKIKTQSREV